MISIQIHMEIIKRIVLIISFLTILSGTSFGQISIIPEVGVSYLPFHLNGANTDIFSRKADMIYGLSALMSIHNNWIISSRIAYADREDHMWMELCTCPGYQYTKFEQSHISLDFGILYTLSDYFNVGIGPNVIRRLKTGTTILDTAISPNPIYSSEDRFEYGFQFLFGVDVSFAVFRLEYGRIIDNNQLRYPRIEGRNRYNAIIGIPILRSERK